MISMGSMRGIACASVLCLTLAACSGGTGATPQGTTPPTGPPETTSPTDPVSEVVPLRIASDSTAAGIPIACGMETLKERLNGLFDVQIFHSSQLGTAAQILQLVAAGQFDASLVGAGQLAAFYPPIGIFSSIYMIDDFDHFKRVWDGPVGDDLKEGLAEENLVPLTAHWLGARQLTANTPVRTPDDMKGLKLRIPPGSDVAFTNARAWGASPVTMPFGELYLAMSQGVVDAQENPIESLEEGRFHEVQDYLSLTNHEPLVEMLTTHSGFLDSLSPEHLAALEAASREVESAVFDCTTEAESKLLAKWKAEGTWKEIIEDPDIEAFRAQALPILLEEYESVWAELDLVDRIRTLSEN